jgi:hypothetical protein
MPIFASACLQHSLSPGAAIYRRPRLVTADMRWGRKDNNAVEMRSMPSVLRFPRSRTNPTRRLARGMSGRTSIFAAEMCPAPKDRLGTIEAPSPTATTLFIASTLSNSINGLGGGTSSATAALFCLRQRLRGLSNVFNEKLHSRAQGSFFQSHDVRCSSGHGKFQGQDLERGKRCAEMQRGFLGHG